MITQAIQVKPFSVSLDYIRRSTLDSWTTLYLFNSFIRMFLRHHRWRFQLGPPMRRFFNHTSCMCRQLGENLSESVEVVTFMSGALGEAFVMRLKFNKYVRNFILFQIICNQAHITRYDYLNGASVHTCDRFK